MAGEEKSLIWRMRTGLKAGSMKSVALIFEVFVSDLEGMSGEQVGQYIFWSQFYLLRPCDSRSGPRAPS